MAKKNKRSSSSCSNEIESKKTKRKKMRKKMRKTKTKKMRKRGVEGGGINSLPDSILHHVLSFLSMKQAIRTSLVSKRWRYLWTCTPSLNFTNTKTELMEFVDAVLILRDSNCNIQRLSITNDDDDDYDYDYYDDDSDDHYYTEVYSFSSFDDHDHDNDDDDDSVSDYDSDNSVYFSDSEPDYDYNYNYSVNNPKLRLNRWILTAVRCNVEEIHLDFHFNKRVKLPHSLFTCNSLRKLKLISLDRDPHELVLPDSSINLPRLEILYIDGLSFHHEDDDKINTFLSGCCYSLKYLTLRECGIHGKNLNIVAPNLKRLVINQFIHNDSRKYKHLKHRRATGSVRICAPNLISFYCKDYLLKNYYLENTSSTLVEAYIDMKVSSKAIKVAGVLEKGRNAMIHHEKKKKKKIDFRILHNVEDLQLNAWALQIFIATYGLSDSGFTEFQDLRSLKLETWLSGECIRGIIWLLNISPNIVNLSLKVIQDTITPDLPHWDEIQLNPSDIGDYWELSLQSEEHTIYDHLSTVEIRGLEGHVNELKFLEVLLKNAVVLEKLILVFCLDSGNRDRERQLIKYSEILHSFPIASSTVKIFFISSS